MAFKRVVNGGPRTKVDLCCERLLATRNPIHKGLASVVGLVDVVEVEDFRVPGHVSWRSTGEVDPGAERERENIHHNLPCVHWQIRIVERPVEFLLRFRFVGWIVVGREVFVRKPITGANSLLRVKDQHALQKIHRWGLLVWHSSSRFANETYLRDPPS